MSIFLCIDDNCVDVLCEPGQRRCDGPTPERCNDNGTAWEPDSDCASGCLYGDCLAGALSGDVSGELCGAYVITADLQVPQGFSVSLCAGSLLHLGSSTLRVAGTLEVAEGVTVYAEAGSAIQVSGTLTVLGDAQAEVVMRPPPESPDARHGGVDVEASGVVNLEHMVIEGSALGLDVALGGTATGSDLRFVDTATGVRSRSASVQLTRLDFSNNTTCADLSAGILEDSVLGSCSSVGAQLSGEATLTHSNISTTGEGVRVTGGAPSIEHNNIRDNHGNGIVVLDGEPAIHHNNVHGNARQASRWYARASFSCSVGYREDPFFESQTFTAPGDSGVTEVTTELRYGSYCSARGTVGGGELWSSACHSCPGISDPYCRDEGARTFPPQGTLSVGLACSTHCLSDYNNRCRSSFTVQAVRLSGGSLIEIYSQSANDIDATDNYFGVALPGDVPERVFNKSGSTITSPYAAAPVVGAGPR